MLGFTPFTVIQALAAAGHVLPLQHNTDVRIDFLQLSVVRWRLQQGILPDSQLLHKAAFAGRTDILQLAHTLRLPITADMIRAAATKSKWEVLVRACRNGVPFDYERMQQLLRQKDPRHDFYDQEQQAELLSLLQHMHEHASPLHELVDA